MVPVGTGNADYREPTLAASGDAGAEAAEPQELDTAAEIRAVKVPAALHGERLDKVLVAIAPEFSRSHLQQLIARGHVRLDGAAAATASRRVKAGQAVQIELVPTEESLAYRPQPMTLAVLYEDDDLLVIAKPAGLVVHPAPGNWSGTLLNGLLHRYKGAAALPRAGIVHRLDKDTSGVMMVGKTLQAVTALVRDIGERRVHRRYLALAHGVTAAREFTIDSPIGRDPQVRVRMAVVAVAAGGRPSRTDVHRLAEIGSGRDAVSALSCTLHTGRTHQIRVHLASCGHPVLADVLYGGWAQLGLQRQALHAFELRLAHPVSRAPLRFECPPPADFATAWAMVCGAAMNDGAPPGQVTRYNPPQSQS